ncbi:putative peroxiredoxin [Bradyrhizobium sp. AZCC 2289]
MNATYQLATALLTLTLAVSMFVTAQLYTAHRVSKDPVPRVQFSTVKSLHR